MATKKSTIPLFVSGVFTAFCLAYSGATRFTDFLIASRSEKTSIYMSLVVLTILFSMWVVWVLIPKIAAKISPKALIMILGISALILAGIFVQFYKLPPFPEEHQITISGNQNINSLSTGSRIGINTIKMVTFPTNQTKRIPVNQLTLEGNWQRAMAGYGILAGKSQGVSVSFRVFMQGGMSIEFQTGPDSGIVNILWDGKGYLMDLYSPDPGIRFEMLVPELNWQKADPVRKILVGIAVLTDFSSLLIIFSLIGIFIYQLTVRREWRIRQPQLLVIGAALILLSWVAVANVNSPVVFENKQIEKAVRTYFNIPSGNIYPFQLLSVVKLDASSQNITSLKGIEQLPNLMNLKLRNNLITDISPLSQLKYLQKLNIRNNAIKDLSPLAQLTGLKYLNIHSNPGIASISPLRGLTNLKTLIMGNVSINGEYEVLANFWNLKKLNLRNSEVNDLEVISGLINLQYLNLYANPDITSFAALQNLGDLRTLMLADDAVGDQLKDVGKLFRLQYLNLRNAHVTDLTPISQLVNLEYLNLHSNPNIKTIAPLKSLVRLKTLILRNVPVGDEVTVLHDFSDLSRLNIRNCQITDLSVVGEMLSRGELQDNPHFGRTGQVDIRDNLVPEDSTDHYATMRPYWQNISDRRPYLLPFFASLKEPQFSQPAGFYEKIFQLELSTGEPDASIHYTLDNTEPTKNSPVYFQPIQVASRAEDPNKYSAIENIATDWHKPTSEVAKATVVRAKVFNSSQNLESAAVTYTYFVGNDLKNHYTLPVISLATDGNNLFDPKTGIYVLGQAYEDQADSDLTEDERQVFANYNQHGRAWERPISIELFENGGWEALSQNGGVRIHGAGSRRNPQKTLRFYARSDYASQDLFNYPLFGWQPNNSTNQAASTYEMFLMRDSGQDWMKSNFRDAFVQSLVSNSRLDTQAGRPIIAFLDGEYWGIYNLQERYDEYYLANHYRIDPSKAVILRQDGELYRGLTEDVKQYSALMSFLRKNNLSDQKNYDYIQTQVDVEDYIDYLITEIYAGNSDWPDNNIYLWRMRADQYDPNAPYGQDGRWRWMLFDLDFGFGLQGGIEDIQQNTLKIAQDPGWGGLLFRSLLKNDQFRNTFISRFADLLNTSYTPERVARILDQEQAVLKPEMNEFIQRWEPGNYSIEQWQAEVDIMRQFALNRPDAVRQQISDQFGLGGTATLTIKADPTKGYVKVNTIAISSETKGVVNQAEWNGIYFKGLPVTVTAIPNHGYKFTGWEGNGQKGIEILLNLIDDVKLTALFEKQ
jgi:Leucine-rich repeat (LRR) protein